jgi:hypothetical protein
MVVTVSIGGGDTAVIAYITTGPFLINVRNTGLVDATDLTIDLVYNAVNQPSALKKSWQHIDDYPVKPVGTSEPLLAAQKTFHLLVSALLGLQPMKAQDETDISATDVQGTWAVEGSSDGDTAGMDSANRLMNELGEFDASKFVYGEGGDGSAHSWIVLAQVKRTACNTVQTGVRLLLSFMDTGGSAAGRLWMQPSSTAFEGGDASNNPTSSTAGAVGINAGLLFPVSGAEFVDSVHPFMAFMRLSTEGDWHLFAKQSDIADFYCLLSFVETEFRSVPSATKAWPWVLSAAESNRADQTLFFGGGFGGAPLTNTFTGAGNTAEAKVLVSADGWAGLDPEDSTRSLSFPTIVSAITEAGPSVVGTAIDWPLLPGQGLIGAVDQGTQSPVDGGVEHVAVGETLVPAYKAIQMLPLVSVPIVQTGGIGRLPMTPGVAFEAGELVTSEGGATATVVTQEADCLTVSDWSVAPAPEFLAGEALTGSVAGTGTATGVLTSAGFAVGDTATGGTHGYSGLVWRVTVNAEGVGVLILSNPIDALGAPIDLTADPVNFFEASEVVSGGVIPAVAGVPSTPFVWDIRKDFTEFLAAAPVVVEVPISGDTYVTVLYADAPYSIGDSVVGETSEATGEITEVTAEGFTFIVLTGTFLFGEGLTVDGATGGGTPPVAAPLVSNIIPAAGAALTPKTVVKLDVTNETGVFRLIELVAYFPKLNLREVIWDGVSFGPAYDNAQKAKSAITNGFHFEFARNNGWPMSPTILPRAINLTGEENA